MIVLRMFPGLCCLVFLFFSPFISCNKCIHKHALKCVSIWGQQGPNCAWYFFCFWSCLCVRAAKVWIIKTGASLQEGEGGRERQRERKREGETEGGRDGGGERERERCHVLPVLTPFTSPGSSGMEVLSAAAASCARTNWNKDSSSEFVLSHRPARGSFSHWTHLTCISIYFFFFFPKLLILFFPSRTLLECVVFLWEKGMFFFFKLTFHQRKMVMIVRPLFLFYALLFGVKLSYIYWLIARVMPVSPSL